MPRDEFEQALTVLYGLKGWDAETGDPTRERLEALSLGWAADLLGEQVAACGGDAQNEALSRWIPGFL